MRYVNALRRFHLVHLGIIYIIDGRNYDNFTIALSSIINHVRFIFNTKNPHKNMTSLMQHQLLFNKDVKQIRRSNIS